MGPGEYEPERADQLTKPKAANVDMGSSPSRPERVGQAQVPSSILPYKTAQNKTETMQGVNARKNRPEVAEKYKNAKSKNSMN